MTVVVVVLAFPARATVEHWGTRQLAVNQPGSFLHGVGEVLVTIFL